MQNWLLKVYLNRQKKMQMNRQKCLECNQISSPTKQLSVFNLIVWVLLGIATSCGLHFFTDVSSVVIPGFLVIVVATFINVKLLKPQCRHCFSEKLTKDWEEQTATH